MATLHELLAQGPDLLLSLPAEELAVVLLKDLARRDNQGDLITRLEFDQPDVVLRALAEAWAWLESACCIAPRPKRNGAFFVTRRGHELAASTESSAFIFDQTLPRQLLHPLIEEKAAASFLRGEYDVAVLVSFKQLEIAIRSAGGFPAESIGVSLARDAFNVETGPLTDLLAVRSERQSLSDLMAGAIGSCKNPLSHREVPLDAKTAAELVILASHLLKIVDARCPPATSAPCDGL